MRLKLKGDEGSSISPSVLAVVFMKCQNKRDTKDNNNHN